MAMTRMLKLRVDRKAPKAAESKFATWADRAYFLAGYFSGLCALGLVGWSIFGTIDFHAKDRDRAGWDLSQPEKVQVRKLGN